MSAPTARDVQVGQLLLALLQRHFIVLRAQAQKGNDSPMVDSYSCCPMSVHGQWYLATAGHCIQKLTNASKSGYTVKCELIDGLGKLAHFKEPIPFAFDPSEIVSMDMDGADFGVIRLDYLSRRLLEANNIAALDEEAWKFRPKPYKPERYLLVGVPEQLTIEAGTNVSYHPCAFPLTKMSRRPIYFEKSGVPTFYGKATLDPETTSIVGMSGGPIFSMQRIDGQVNYWVHAIQSRWWEPTRVVKAPLIRGFGLAIEAAHLRIASNA